MIDRYVNLKDSLTFKELEYDLIDSWNDLPFVNEWTTKQVKELHDEYYVIPKTGCKETVIRHGHWDEYEVPHIICCSECDWATGIEEKFFKYCPMCGSKMDGGVDNE